MAAVQTPKTDKARQDRKKQHTERRTTN